MKAIAKAYKGANDTKELDPKYKKSLHQTFTLVADPDGGVEFMDLDKALNAGIVWAFILSYAVHRVPGLRKEPRDDQDLAHTLRSVMSKYGDDLVALAKKEGKRVCVVIKDAHAGILHPAFYRGHGGKLPQEFEKKTDAHGLLTVVEPGCGRSAPRRTSASRRDATGTAGCTSSPSFGRCMSSSLDEGVVDHYRDKHGGQDVVWHIRSKPETDDAFHCGADVSLLSQFPSAAGSTVL